MSKEQPTKISIDPTSIINLKAELFKKQDEYRLKKLAQSKISTESEYETNKTVSTWGKKKIKSGEEAKTSAESDIQKQEPEEPEEDAILKSKRMLESKARYYEQVTTGQKRTGIFVDANKRNKILIVYIKEKGDDEIFLVNFDQKVVENRIETEIESEEKTNKFKLKNEISELDYNEQLRLKWEKEKYENLEKLNIRYQDIKYDEIRNLGVGSFKFSKDEAERQEQMEFFKNLQIETKTNRIENEIYNLKREKILKERLNKVKQRRLLKHGYSLAEIKDLCQYDKEIEEIDQEITELEEIAKNPQLHKPKTETSDSIEDFDTTRMKKKINLDREWDKPKLKEKFWEKHVAKLRSERQKQFAPPKAYDKNKKGGKNQKPAKTEKPKEPKLETNNLQERSDEQTNSSFSFYFPQTMPSMPAPVQQPGVFFPFPFPQNFSIPPPNFQFQQQNFKTDNS